MHNQIQSWEFFVTMNLVVILSKGVPLLVVCINWNLVLGQALLAAQMQKYTAWWQQHDKFKTTLQK